MPLLIFMMLLRASVYAWLLLFTWGLLIEEGEKWHARIKKIRVARLQRRIAIVLPFPRKP